MGPHDTPSCPEPKFAESYVAGFFELQKVKRNKVENALSF